MAAKKKAASAADAGKIIVAFVLRDHVEGEGDDEVTFTAGQRLELEQKEFDGLAKAGICVEGVFVKMRTAVEGGRYSLKPHDTTWLAPHVYEAWKAAGYCEPTEDDPEVSAVLKARVDALREAMAELDVAKSLVRDEAELRAALQLELVAARAQAEVIKEALWSVTPFSDDLDGGHKALHSAVDALIDMLPDQIEGAGDGAEPELNLS